MRILVTGATGYVGGNLIPLLLEARHEVHALVRDPKRAADQSWSSHVTMHQGDLLNADSLATLPHFDAAYYLVHSMADSGAFQDAEATSAHNFANNVHTDHCIYLGGLQPKRDARAHLASRATVGTILAQGLPTTEFRAGPIIGSGSTSFEMVRYLSERLPVMVTPRWTRNLVQCIAIDDVTAYLVAALQQGPAGIVDIGGQTLSFADMLRRYAELRGLRRRLLLPTPFLAPRLAARWVGFVTPIPNRLAVPIIDGARAPLHANLAAANRIFPGIHPRGYAEAVRLALTQQDSLSSTPQQGAETSKYRLADEQNHKRETRSIQVDAPAEQLFAVVAGLGGTQGWLAWNWAWQARGAVDRLLGGPGMRRTPRNTKHGLIAEGETLDFWRVEAIQVPHLLRLRAEMRLPGRAWLEFHITPIDANHSRLVQTALFEPQGVPGLLYWNALYPIHRWLFHDLIRAIAKEAKTAHSTKLESTSKPAMV